MKLKVLGSVDHDGAQYAEGDVVDVKDEVQAAALIEAGVAEKAASRKAATVDE